jgi:three-Cys-motif partner protein
LRGHLVTIFNDKDENHTRTLARQIAALPGVGLLKHKPQVMNEEVGDNVVKMFAKTKLIPTFFFVDPWGYKGLSLKLINAVLRNWGCDCIFFFNYNRINPGLSNPMVKEHMDALFEEERADALRVRLATMQPAMRELAIVEAISEALKEMGGRYVLPFTFKREDGSRTTHYLIFVSKHVRGYEVMKDIMARASSSHDEGVPSFSYCPALARTPLLLEFARPLSELGSDLCGHFAGQTLTMKEVYERHHVDRPFFKKNYKHALARLEAEGRITAQPAAEERPTRNGQPTFSDTVCVIFP